MTPSPGDRLGRGFFTRPARAVAVDLLGHRLVSTAGGTPAGGIIVETEAYCDAGAADLACHGSRNRGRPTGRTAVMFGPPGHAYVYFTYGMHWLFNVVTGVPGQPSAVLVRALEPDTGLAAIAERRLDRRGRPLSSAAWTNGPAKLAAALGIDGALHGADLCAPEAAVWIEAAFDVPREDVDVAAGPRIGIAGVPEPWRSLPWRYWIRGNPWVSV